MKVRNLKLLGDIKEYYLTGKKTLKEIAEMNELSLGSCKNFLYRNQINKKEIYSSRKEHVSELYDKGLTLKEIAKLMDCSTQNIGAMLRKEI